jgi:hypothetical protein
VRPSGAASQLGPSRRPARFTIDPTTARNGGGGGIRTHGTVACTRHFQCRTFGHSATPPRHCQTLLKVRSIWRRGEDLNPRGTCAPIRFRVGRLQPGSATPPRNSISMLHVAAAINLRVSTRGVQVLSKFHPIRRRDEPLDCRAQVIGGEVAVALDHGQALPAPQLLDRAQVYPSHDEPGGESVPVAVPRVPLEMLGALAGRLQRPLGPLHSRREELVWLSIRAREDELGVICRSPAVHRNAQQGGLDQAVHGDLARAAVLGVPHREEAGQEIHIPPLQRPLLAPPEPSVHADREERAQGGRQSLA